MCGNEFQFVPARTEIRAVEAWRGSTTVARGDSRVVARNNAIVFAMDNASVETDDSAKAYP